MLRIEGLCVAYGGLAALTEVSVEVERGQFTAIVGPNGAGKTTLFKSVSGTVPIRQGRILFEGQDISSLSAAKRPHLGIAHVPEGRKVFSAMTVLENLEVGATTRAGHAAWRSNLEQIFALFPILATRRSQLAGTLSGGEQQMVAIARGLASAPKLLMLDEPSMGLSPAMTDLIFDCIRRLHSEMGLTILMVEQRVAEALEHCDRGYVLETGKVVLSGTMNQLSANDKIRQAYLGM
jgi:branched-chain amino acid transport system ATP-binding protein